MFRVLRFALGFSSLALVCAKAQVMYLTGALAYVSNESGNHNGSAFEYDTFPGTANSKFQINGATNIAIPLNVGTNSFSVSGASGAASPYIGIGLYFSSTATPFSGPQDAAPNLVIFDHGNSGTSFGFAASGSLVATYGQFSAVVPYSGLTSYSLAGHAVTVTGFDFDSNTLLGTLNLSVVAIPEPSVMALLGTGLVVAGATLRFRGIL